MQSRVPLYIWTHLLIRNGIRRVTHQLLHLVNAPHLRVYLAQDLGALLQTEDDVLLDLGELDARRQLLELLELGVRLGQQGLLIFLAAQGQQGLLLVAFGNHLAGDVRLLVGENGDTPLVLVESVALDLHVEDGPVILVWIETARQGT